MVYETDFLITTDHLRLHTARWLPDGTPAAIVIFVHGVGEHCGRYHHVGEFLNRSGYALYALDHRGHGRSDGLRAYFPKFSQPVNDLAQYVEQIAAENPGVPLVMMGHSMGSLLSLMYVLRHQERLAGWISSGSPLTVDELIDPVTMFAGRVLRAVIPTLPMVSLSGSDMTHDAMFNEIGHYDPLNNHAGNPIATVAGIVLHGRELRKQLAAVRLPVLLLHGEADAVTPVSASHLIHERIGSVDKTLHIYAGMFHEILMEIDRQRVLDDLLAWLKARF